MTCPHCQRPTHPNRNCYEAVYFELVRCKKRMELAEEFLEYLKMGSPDPFTSNALRDYTKRKESLE